MCKADGFGGLIDHCEAAAIGCVEVVTSEGGGDGPGSYKADVQEQNVIEIFGHGAEVVVDGDDGSA